MATILAGVGAPARIIKNVRTQYISFGEALVIRVKKFKHNLRENYSKSTKIAITACKFSKISGEACPRTHLELFLFLNQLQTSSAEKNTLEKNVEIMASFLKFLATPLLPWFCIRPDKLAKSGVSLNKLPSVLV